MMRFIAGLRHHKILFWTIVFGWIIFAIGVIGGINPVESSVVSDYIDESFNGILLYFFAVAALPAITVGLVFAELVCRILAIESYTFVYLPLFLLSGGVAQTFLYFLLGKLLGKVIWLFSKTDSSATSKREIPRI